MLQKNYDTLEWRMKKPWGSNTDSNALLDNLEIDIQTTMKKKSWNALDLCFKWKYIQEYLKGFDWVAEADVDTVKALLSKKQLINIVYNTKTQCISKLGITVGTNAI